MVSLFLLLDCNVSFIVDLFVALHELSSASARTLLASSVRALLKHYGDTLRPVKGNGVVIMDHTEYIDCCLAIINDREKFKCLHKDPTQIREGKLQRFLRKLRSEGQLEETTYRNIYATGSQPARFYGLPKLHKKRAAGAPPPLRPIVSSIGAYKYNLSEYLASILGPCIPEKHTTLDSFSFVNEFTNIQSQNKFMISFDVESLFTNIPLSETIDLALEIIFRHNPEFPINKANLRELFTFVTSQTHFLFNGLFYDQCDGVAMGSPLAPILASLFMGYHEEQ